ncbi:MAG: ABC transporter ATP-binding protein [Bacteroidota bacterium]
MSRSTVSARSEGVIQQFREMLRYWAKAAYPFRWYFVGIYGFYALGIVADSILIPIYFQQMVDTMVTGTEGMQPEVLGFKYEQLLQFALMIGLLHLIRNLAYRSGDWFYDGFQLGTSRNLENGMFDHYLKHGRQFFVNHFAGGLLNDHRQMRGAFELFLDRGTFTFFWWLIVFTGSLVSLGFIFPVVAIGILVWFVAFLAVVILVSRVKLKHERRVSSLNSSMTGLLADNLSNAMTIKTFGAEERETQHYSDRNQLRFKARHRNRYWSRWRNGLQGIMLIFLDVGVLLVSAYYWYNGWISPGVIVLVLYYTRNISEEVWNFSRMINAMTQAFADANKFMDHVRQEPHIVDGDQSRLLVCKTSSEDVEIRGISPPAKVLIKKGQIRFDNVTFAYPDGAAVFDQFNCLIRTGEKVGIVGPSGSGKSTIVTLLQRHMDVQQGAILIDGIDIRQLKQTYLRSKISLVPQDPSLFHRSLRENIAYGKPGASMSEIEAAARKAQAHDFIMETANGYETTVGERGIKLSGGQRQRIAIARAILETESAPIVIFDEATSSLDNVAEKEIQAAIDAALADSSRTAIIIAHRLSTLRNVDRILVLERGQIVESGTHEELRDANGLYADLYFSQMLEVA